MAREVQDAVHRQQGQFGLSRVAGVGGLGCGPRVRENHVAQVVRLAGRLDERRAAGSGEGQDVGGRVYLAELPVKPVDLLVAGDDEGDGGACGRALAAQRCCDGFLQAGRVNLAGEIGVYLNVYVKGCVLWHYCSFCNPQSAIVLCLFVVGILHARVKDARQGVYESLADLFKVA